MAETLDSKGTLFEIQEDQAVPNNGLELLLFEDQFEDQDQYLSLESLDQLSTKLTKNSSISTSSVEINNNKIENTPKRKRGWLDYMRGKAGSISTGIGRIQGSILNKLVHSGMQTPIVKYLLSPQTLKKALNNDPILSETYKIIFKSEAVQHLLTPEAFQIMLDSETATNFLTPQNILIFLNSKIVADFINPENIHFILHSEVMRKALTPQALLENLDSKAFKNFLEPRVMHEIAYSPFFTGVMTPDILVSFLNTQAVRNVMTTEAIKDALACPGSIRTMNQEMVDKLLDTQGAQNLLDHPLFKDQSLRFFETIFNN